MKVTVLFDQKYLKMTKLCRIFWIALRWTQEPLLMITTWCFHLGNFILLLSSVKEDSMSEFLCRFVCLLIWSFCFLQLHIQSLMFNFKFACYQRYLLSLNNHYVVTQTLEFIHLYLKKIKVFSLMYMKDLEDKIQPIADRKVSKDYDFGFIS